MVHGLRTLRKLNAQARDGRVKNKHPGPLKKVPDAIALHPNLARRYANSPWTDREGGSEGIIRQ